MVAVTTTSSSSAASKPSAMAVAMPARAGDVTDSLNDAGKNLKDLAHNTGEAAKGAWENVSNYISDKAAEVQKNANSDSVRESLTSLVQNAVKKDGLPSAIKYLDKADADRLADVGKGDNGELNKTIDDLQQAYKQKYDKDFELNEDNLFKEDGTQYRQMKVKSPSDIKPWPAPATGALDSNSAGSSDAGNRLHEGEDIALFHLPKTETAPALTVSEVCRDDHWVAVVPASLDSQKLRDNLRQHLSSVLQQKGQWPSDAKQAQSAVARHVLMAFYDVDSTSPAVSMAR